MAMHAVPAAWDEGRALSVGRYTPASDLYQVGRMLQQALVCNPQFQSPEAEALVAQLLSKKLTVQQAHQQAWLTQAA